MSNKKGLILVILGLIIISGIGISYAYYISKFYILNKDNASSNVTAGSLVEAVLEVPTNDDYTNIMPGNKFFKKYIVKGKGNSKSKSILASLIVKPNLGEYSKYVYWSLYKSTEEITCENSLTSSTCNIPENATLVLSGNEDTTHINIEVSYDTNDKYYLVTEYVNSDEDQSSLMTKTFDIDVSLEQVEDTIQNKITAELDMTGKCPTVNSDGSVNVTGVDSENALLCSAPDNYGTSYYYQGNVSNNYVKFAGFYWRIVRINGDGSIRIIYDGTSAHENGEESADRHIGLSAFNEKDDDNAYVGYMYGTPGSSTYEETHANINDSTIKKYIDNWYENNILGTSYEHYLADNSFCNDRSFKISNTGTGIGITRTSYGLSYNYNGDAMLICPQHNDAFTVNDAIKGNNSLTYPISLLTAAEFLLVSGINEHTNKSFLYTGYLEWLLSPIVFNGSIGFGTYYSFKNTIGNVSVTDNGIGTRIVINLKPNSLVLGNGTIDNPYQVKS